MFVMSILSLKNLKQFYGLPRSVFATKTLASISSKYTCQIRNHKRGVTSGNSTAILKMDYSRFINISSLRRQVSPIRELTKLYAIAPPGTIFLAGGIPNATTFPFAKVAIELKDGLSFSLDGKTLENALQYQPTPGYMPLVKQLKDLQTKVHGLTSDFWDKNDLLVTVGSQDGLCKAVEMSLEDGEPILVQEPIYSGTLAILKAFNPKMTPITADEFGMCPKKLQNALAVYGTPEQVRSKQSGVPKMLYLNSTGANPTGLTISTERKKEIYKIACEYDLIILEDDPYYFLHFEQNDPVSFLSMDTEGRVLRFDSFSKVLSSGLRLGFVTGPKALANRIELHMQASVMHASSLPQVLVDNLLSEWGSEKLTNHFKTIQAFYKSKRDSMVIAVEKHLTGLVDWTVPKAGMFLWLKVRGVKDTRRMVSEGGVAHGVIMVPGNCFMVDESAPCPYIRASYTIPSAEDMDEGCRRLAELIKEELKQQN